MGQMEERDRDALLAVRNIGVGYGEGAQALRGVSLDVPAGTVVALLGANGAGKTSLLRAISGLLPMQRGRVSSGTVTFDGERIERLAAPAIVRRGISQVMEGRRVFAELTVDENLRAGAYSVRRKAEVRDRLAYVLELFPPLAQRRRAVAGYLSGGEQQMVAFGRALMQSPRLLMLDEPSLGLAPLVVQQIRETIVRVRDEGTAVLLVEQNAAMALELAETGYVLRTGRVVKHGPAEELLRDREVREFYLGMDGEARRRVRDTVGPIAAPGRSAA
jgi:branched-chain amino acid transport system ATP-binding protein